MGYTLGPVLSVGGEKEYTKAMATIRDSMKYVSAEAAVATSAFGKNEKSVESLTAKNTSLKKALGTLS